MLPSSNRYDTSSLTYAASNDFLSIAAKDNQRKENDIPDYLRAANTHTIGNSGGFSFLDPSTWGTAIGSAAEATADFATKGAFSALASGIHSFYNTGVAVNNFFGGNAEAINTADALANIDSDLGQYYVAHKEGIDLAGFIATSFIPGTLGIKALNAASNVLKAAKTGSIGTGIGESTGLLAPVINKFTRAATDNFVQAQSTFTAANSNVLKALATGFGQAALESAAFEVAVAATMNKSPILDSLDTTDMLKNIGVGTLLGGGIGGVITGIKTFGKIKSSLKLADKELAPISHINELGAGFTPADSIISRVENLDQIKNAEVTTSNLSAETIQRTRTKTQERVSQLLREDVHAMTADAESETANLVADLISGMDKEQVFRNFQHATQLGRVGSKLEAEKAALKTSKRLEELGNPAGVSSATNVGYIKLAGEGAGDILFGPTPRVLSIADNLPGTVSSIRQAVDDVVSSYKFKETKPWDALTASHSEAEARYLWKAGAKVSDGMTVHENDIPLLEKLLDTWSKQEKGLQALESPLHSVNILDSQTPGFTYTITNSDDLLKHLLTTKEQVAGRLIAGAKAGTGVSTEEIAKITNMRMDRIEGDVSSDVGRDYFSSQYVGEKYTKELIQKGLWKESQGAYPLEYKPTYIKMAFDTSKIQDISNFELDALTYLTAKQKMQQTAIDNVVAPILGEDFARLYHPGKEFTAVNRYGAGAGLVTSANGGYGTMESWAEHTGSVFNGARQKTLASIDDTFTSAGIKLVNKPEAAVEYSAIDNLIASTAEHYTWNATHDALIPRALKWYQDDVAAGVKGATYPKFAEGTPLSIPVKNAETRLMFELHMDRNITAYSKNRDLRAAQGLTNEKHLSNPNDPSGKLTPTMYPIKPNPKDFPHIAYVTDETVTGVGHVKMIHAATTDELASLISKVPPEFKVHTNPESINFHKAQGDYAYERTLHENYIDTALKRSGAYARFQPLTDPTLIVNNIIDFHKRQETTLLREGISAKFDPEFAKLRKLNEQYLNLEGSKLKGTVAIAEAANKGPFLSYIKTSLGISRADEYPLLQGLNNILDSSFSRVTKAVGSAWNSVSSKGASLDEINTIFKDAGIKTGYYDAATVLHANHTAPKGELTKYIRDINAVIGTLTLRIDPMNALNNAVGSPIMYGAEANHLIRGIKASNPEIAGKLAQLLELQIPEVQAAIRTPGKLLSNSISAFMSPEPELHSFFKANGWTTTHSEQFRDLLDTAALKGTEDAATLSSKKVKILELAKTLADKGEKFSGNKLAEEFNRFTSAHTMWQLTQLAEKAEILTPRESLSYINSFVNRTQGNMLAAQRPIIFQGPIGQAIGLFQTYQFNLMQQMFRHVSEGTSKDAAFLLGLQGTIYGLNGLPAFNFINQHIVGTASGNKEHKDLYDATYGILGKQMGELAMYGIPSSILQANLYTRGDINPRHPSIVPINPMDVPAIAVPIAAFKNIKDTLGKIAGGGDVWNSILQGIEHNGISRPLAGFAQVAQGISQGQGKVYSTTSKGNLLYANDLWSIATAARLVGGKPIDEAISNDATYRITAYNAVDRERKVALAEAVKSQVIGSGESTSDDVQNFAEQYTALGGKQTQFNQWMMEQIKNANTSRVDQIVKGLKGRMGQKMQILMGGEVSGLGE